MRRLVAVMVGFALLLCGCSAKNQSIDTAMAFRSKLLNAEQCTFTAQVEAQYEEYACVFTLQCAYRPADDTLDFTVQAPETIAGISGSVLDDRQTVSFDDTTLQMQLLAGEKLAPVALPALLAQSWASSYIDSGGKDRDYEIILYQNGYEQDTLEVETWFAQGLPVYADVWYEGIHQAGVTVSNVQFQ